MCFITALPNEEKRYAWLKINHFLIEKNPQFYIIKLIKLELLQT